LRSAAAFFSAYFDTGGGAGSTNFGASAPGFSPSDARRLCSSRLASLMRDSTEVESPRRVSGR